MGLPVQAWGCPVSRFLSRSYLPSLEIGAGSLSGFGVVYRDTLRFVRLPAMQTALLNRTRYQGQMQI